MIRPDVVLGLWAALLGAARAETVTVIAPEGGGPGGPTLAAELGVGVDAALARAPGYARASAGAALPGEVVTVFGCLRLDLDCAVRAGEAAGADLVLTGRAERDGDDVRVSLALIDVRRREPRRTLARQLRALPPGPPPDAALRAALHALPALLLDAAPPPAAGLVVAAPEGAALRLDGDPLLPDRLVPLPPGAPRITARAADGRLLGAPLALGTDEVLLIDATRLPPAPDGPRRIGAWMTLGLGLAAALGAGYMALRLDHEQSDYNRARSAGALTEHRERGEKAALAGNVLLGTSAAAFGVSLWLFLE